MLIHLITYIKARFEHVKTLAVLFIICLKWHRIQRQRRLFDLKYKLFISINWLAIRRKPHHIRQGSSAHCIYLVVYEEEEHFKKPNRSCKQPYNRIDKDENNKKGVKILLLYLIFVVFVAHGIYVCICAKRTHETGSNRDA